VPSVSFDPIAARYDATRGGEARGRVIADVLRRWLPETGPVVEIGVGTGVVATAVATTGAVVVGLDVSAAMLDVAAARFPGPLLQADAGAAPLRTGSVGAVTAVWVLHLVSDRPAVFGECRRLLRRDGRLLGVIFDRSRRVADPRVLELERRYRHRADDLETLQGAAEAAGFRTAHVEPIPAFARPATSAQTADLLEQRTWSWLWDIPPDAWAADVVPVIESLRREADQTPVMSQQVAHQLVVWER
jgi:ubiquinone/menaquinone biosynthesis C-methylase UbiE